MDIKLTNIKIKNFLSYKDEKFSNIKDYNVLIGKNNSGKSNLYKIFEMIIASYNGQVFNKSFLYNKDENLDASIELTFQLSEQLREQLVNSLIAGNRLEKSFAITENLSNYPKRNEMKNEKTLLKWFISEKYFKELQVTIKHFPKIMGIAFSQVSISSFRIKKPFVLFELDVEDKNFITKVVKTSQWYENPLDLDTFLSQNKLEKAGKFNSNDIRSSFNHFRNVDSETFKPILVDLLLKEFFECFRFIPDKRSFLKELPLKSIKDTVLNNNGDNFVRFLHMKKVTNQDLWLAEFKFELQGFIDNIEELRQDVDKDDNTVLELKEEGLSSPFPYENMGAGILNIAHFLAYIKQIGENNMLFIEEPELFLHPGLKKKLKQKFLDISQNNQIFITTHASEFLNNDFEKNSIYLIKKQKNESKIINIDNNNDFEEIYNELDIDPEQNQKQQNIIEDKAFWIKFISKVRNPDITEDIWDFKETLDFWKIKDNEEEKEKAKIKFCEDIISFGNNQGGVIIVGITNKERKIVGVETENLEDRRQKISELINKRIDYGKIFVKTKQIQLEDENNQIKYCLLIIIAQTKDELSVKVNENDYRCKMRLETGKFSFDRKFIREHKKEVRKDNFDFLFSLKQNI